MINQRELQILLNEASELSNKPNWTKQDERRNAYLLAAISAVKSGVSLLELDQAELNSEEERMGVEFTRLGKPTFLSREQRADIEVWQRYFKTNRLEARDMKVGNGTPAYLTGNLGSFVPLEFFKGIFMAQKAADALLDPNVVTYISDVDADTPLSQKGRPIEVPMFGDTENVAMLTTEGATSAEVDIAAPSAIMLGAFAFRSPVFHFSMEALQDVEAMGGVLNMFQAFSADRIRRGVSPYLVTGTGTNQPTGIINALEALGNAAVTAVGNSANTGGAGTGANSVGSADIANLYYALDAAYRDNPKCSWLMNSATLGFLAAMVDKYGQPIVRWEGPEKWILGKPVKICPSMPNIGSQNVPILFGDLSFYGVRATACGVKLYRQYPGLAENGKYGLRAFCRYDGQLLWNDASSPAPIVYLANHS